MLGERLVELRQKNKISQRKLGTLLDLSQSAIAKYERNESEPEIRTLIKMAEIFNVTIDGLILDNEMIVIQKEKYDHLISIARQIEQLGSELVECLQKNQK